MLTFSINTSDIKIANACPELGAILTQSSREWLSTNVLNQIDKQQPLFQSENNIGAFAKICSRNSKMNQARKKEIALVTVGELNEGQIGISVERIEDHTYALNVDELVTKIDNEKTCIRTQFEKLVEEILIQKGINIRTVIKRALENNTTAINRLIKLKNEFGFDELLLEVLEDQATVIELGLKESNQQETVISFERGDALTDFRYESLVTQEEQRLWA